MLVLWLCVRVCACVCDCVCVHAASLVSRSVWWHYMVISACVYACVCVCVWLCVCTCSISCEPVSVVALHGHQCSWQDIVSWHCIHLHHRRQQYKVCFSSHNNFRLLSMRNILKNLLKTQHGDTQQHLFSSVYFATGTLYWLQHMGNK